MEKFGFFDTGFLFSGMNFFTGAGSVLNLAGSYYDFNYSPSGAEADANAIATDWNMVGQDLNNAIAKLREEVNELEKKASKEQPIS